MKKLFTMTFCLLCFVVLQAQTNPKISIQGVLKDNNNVAVADGEYNLTFKLYTETGNSPEWEEIQNGISVTGGIYAAKLGEVTPLPGAIFDEPLFLGVSVNGSELLPRIELTYAPYALSVETAQNVACSGKLGDIKYSILKPIDFAKENGDCWQLMNGDGLASDNPLRTKYGITSLPDARGYFLRAHDDRYSSRVDASRTASTPVGTVQEDNFGSHSHTLGSSARTSSSGSHTHTHNANGGYNATGLAFFDGKETNEGTDDKGTELNSRNTKKLEINHSGSHTHTLSGTTEVTGSTETRP